MTCRHSDPINNPGCTSFRTPQQQLERLKEASLEIQKKLKISDEPDNTQFEIIDAIPVGTSLVLKVKYENCEKCSYEGTKIIVYENVGLKDVLKWKVIDPHFSEKKSGAKCAPSPAARFPASPEGLSNALVTAKTISDSKEP